MAGLDSGFELRGMKELSQAFRLAEKGLSADLKMGLRSVAEPVRFDAERLASAEITHIGIPWSKMRTGVTQTMVYVAPNERGVKTRGRNSRKRPNLATLLRDRALQPALAANRHKIEEEVEHVLNDLARSWSRV